MRPITRRAALWSTCGLAAVGVLAIPLSRGIRSLIWTRGAVTTYARLIAAANNGDLPAIRTLCSERYCATHPLVLAEEGGVTGFPRQIHPNFRVWVEGSEVWLCPSNRVGRVERFVFETKRWKYDGFVGMLQPGGGVVRIEVDPAVSVKKP